MRISGFLMGIVGFVFLIGSTVACALFSYNFSRDGVINLWDSGMPVESVGEVAQAIFNPEDFEAIETPTPLAEDGNGQVVIPSITPDSANVIPTVDLASAQSDDTSATPVAATPVPDQADTVVEPQATATTEFASERWSDPREINILLMGIDERTGFTNERAYRTDTMMVLHIDPVRQTAGVISFPRDLYVTVPNYGQNRLNRANYIGDGDAYPDGAGPGLLMETINTNFGIRVDYYVMINFTVFETVVDRLAPNGVEVCVDEYIYDPTYPDEGFGTLEVEFQVGCQPLDGQRLLQYARTRKTEGGDIDRNERQQQVIEATRQHVMSAGGVVNFITQIGPLWNDLAGSYRTNLTLSEATSLAWLMNDIEDITYTSLGPGYWLPETLENGDQILIPVPSEIQNLIQQTFYPGATLTLSDYRALAEEENVPVRVFNGTNIAGLAGETREYLIGSGVAIESVGNMPSPSDNQTTVVQYYGTSRNTAIYIANVLGLPSTAVQRGNDGLAVNGVIVVAGTDMPGIISAGN